MALDDYEHLTFDGDDQLGWSPFKAVASAAKSVGKVASKGAKLTSSLGKAIVKSNLVRTTVAGAAIVFPPVGVPAAGALVAASAVVAAAESADKARSDAAKRVIANTKNLAASGDAGAKAAFNAMGVAYRVRSGKPAQATPAKPAPAKPAPKAIAAAPRPKALPPARVLSGPPPAQMPSGAKRFIFDVHPDGHVRRVV
jgi:hypothetical protein